MILDLWSLQVNTSSRIILESDTWIQSLKNIIALLPIKGKQLFLKGSK